MHLFRHTGKHSSCAGLNTMPIDVNSKSDVHAIPRLESPVISKTSVPVLDKGVDELANLFSQEVEVNQRLLGDRKIGTRVPPVQQIIQLYEQLGHPAQATLAAISRRLRLQLQQQPAVSKLLALTGGDPARAFVVLKHVAAQADAESRPTEAALAREAIARLEVGFKGEIQAGLNTALSLQVAGLDPQARQELRMLYYASVVVRQSPTLMMKELLRLYGGERFHVGLQAMRKALADDIAALVSSRPLPLLRTLLLSLNSCGQLNGVWAGCRALIERLAIAHDPVELLQRMLTYAGSGIDSTELLTLGHDLGGGPALRQLVALHALHPLFKQLPLALWPDRQVRQDTLQRLVAVMDELDLHLRGRTRFTVVPRSLA